MCRQIVVMLLAVVPMLALPTSAGASEQVSELSAIAGCQGGPGIIEAHLTPAPDGTTSLEFGGLGLWPHGTWRGELTARATAAGPSTTAIPVSQDVARGGFDAVKADIGLPWGHSIAGGAFTSPLVGKRLVPHEAARTRCSLSVGSIGTVSLAESASLRLSVRIRGPKMGAALEILAGRPGSKWSIEVNFTSAGPVQRRRFVVSVRGPGRAIPIKGLRHVGLFDAAKVVATNLRTHASFMLALAANQTERVAAAACQADVSTVATASEAYYAMHGHWATAIDDATHSPTTLVGGGYLHSPPAPTSEVAYDPATGAVTSAAC